MNNWYNFEFKFFIKTSLIQITHIRTQLHTSHSSNPLTLSFIQGKSRNEGRIKGRKVKYRKRIQSRLEKEIILEKTVKRSTECLL